MDNVDQNRDEQSRIRLFLVFERFVITAVSAKNRRKLFASDSATRVIRRKIWRDIQTAEGDGRHDFFS